MLNQDTSNELDDQKIILMENNAFKDSDICNKIFFNELCIENQNFGNHIIQEIKVKHILNELTKRYLEYPSYLLKFNGTNKNVNNSQRQTKVKHKEQQTCISKKKNLYGISNCSDGLIFRFFF
eukprot:164882_1